MMSWQFITWSVSLLALHMVWGHDDGPFVVTPLLEAGKCEEAQKKALVIPDIGGVKSYTGFFNINKKCGNHLFFWLFLAEKDWETAPVVLWLNTFSRRSVLMDVFFFAGPFSYTRENGFAKRKYALTKESNVLFIDHLVGTGFSFTEKECYPDSLEKIYSDVYAAIDQFFMLFPTLSNNKFFIAGQSFAGKYAPGIAMEIDRCNKNATQKINLVGILISGPYLDIRCYDRAQYKYQLGIMDKKNELIGSAYDKKFNDAIDANDYTAVNDLDEKYPALSGNVPTRANILYNNDVVEEFQTFIRSFKIRPQIHVGQTPFHFVNDKLWKSLRRTAFQPVNSCVEELLNTGKYIVGFYGGQLDLDNPYTTIPCVLEGLKWPGVKDYLAANRSCWYEENRLAGWVKVSGNLWEVAVRDSGKYTTRDQPCATYNLLKAALSDTPGKKLLTGLTYRD